MLLKRTWRIFYVQVIWGRLLRGKRRAAKHMQLDEKNEKEERGWGGSSRAIVYRSQAELMAKVYTQYAELRRQATYGKILAGAGVSCTTRKELLGAIDAPSDPGPPPEYWGY